MNSKDSKKITKATRPIFIPKENYPGVREAQIDFDWHKGMSDEVRRRSISSLHKKAAEKGYKLVLEASSKSSEVLGINLSAFNLKDEDGYPVENRFQSSKVFENEKQYIDLLTCAPKQAKLDVRLRNSGKMIRFSYNGEEFPLEPKTLFYDWLYTKILFKSHNNSELRAQLIEKNYEAFSDIAFNPKKSFSCQARTLALCISLYKTGTIDEFLKKPIEFVDQNRIYGINKPTGQSGFLF